VTTHCFNLDGMGKVVIAMLPSVIALLDNLGSPHIHSNC
jgi:hypothetical protein